MTTGLRPPSDTPTCPSLRKALRRLATLGLAVAGLAATAATNAPADARALNKRCVASWQARDEAGARTNDALFVRPGLIADRRARSVCVYAEGLPLNPGDPVEFALISEQSGKDYEALAVSFAQPSDIHRALEFIGLTAGAPTDPARLRFWPRGERVRMTFARLETDGTATPLGLAETTVLDTRTGTTLPEAGFVFCGGDWVAPGEAADATTGRVYAADVYSPNAIVSVYNEGHTVLDVPRRAPQSEVYTFQVPNPAQRLPPGRLLKVTLTPLFPDGADRLVDWSIRLQNMTNGVAGFSVEDARGQPLLQRQPAEAVAAAAKGVVMAGRDLFAVITPDDALSLGALTSACATVSRWEDTCGVRVEPPPEGHAYYKAFLPNPAHRDRSQRPIQPFELALSDSPGGATGVLSLITEEWKENADSPLYHEASWPVHTPTDMTAPFATKDAPAVLLVFAPESMPYGRLRPYAHLAVKRKMILFVFTGRPVGSAIPNRTTPPAPP